MKAKLMLLGLMLFSNVVLAEAPISKLSETVFDFGSVAEGEQIKYTFQIENIGDADLRVEQVLAGCHCLSLDVPKEAILPEESAEITINLDTKGLRGEVLKLVKVFTNEGKHFSTFTVRGVVSPKLEITPEYIDFGELVFGQGASRQVKIKAKEDLKLGKIKSYSKYVSLANLKGSKGEWSLDVILSKDTPLGVFRDRAIIETPNGYKTSVNIPVFANIKGALEPETRTISFGDVSGGDIVKKSIIIRNNLGKKVQIESAESDSNAVSVEVKAFGDAYQIEVILDPSKMKRELRSVVTIKTDLEAQKELSIGVYGYKARKR